MSCKCSCIIAERFPKMTADWDALPCRPWATLGLPPPEQARCHAAVNVFQPPQYTEDTIRPGSRDGRAGKSPLRQ